MSDKQKVYEAIAAVSAELAEQGMAKEGVNDFHRYNFRGIDQVMDALSPLLVKHGLLMLPRCTERERLQYLNKKQEPMFSVAVKVDFDFIAVADGSMRTITVYGEAMDSGDKATNKAMSCAYKYAAFQAFCIPVDVDDADASSPAVATAATAPRHPASTELSAGEQTLLSDEETFETSGVDPDFAFITAQEADALLTHLKAAAKARQYDLKKLLAEIGTKYNVKKLGMLSPAQSREIAEMISGWVAQPAETVPPEPPAPGERKCPQCGKPLALRTNRAKGTKFWSCTGWSKDDPNSCNFSENA